MKITLGIRSPNPVDLLWEEKRAVRNQIQKLKERFTFQANSNVAWFRARSKKKR